MKSAGPYMKIGCSGGALPQMGNNSVHDPDPQAGLSTCGVPLSEWQAQGHDLGTTLGPIPPAADLISAARRLLGLGMA